MAILAKLVLFVFDYFTRKKIFKFIKKRHGKNINIFFDVGSHKGEYIDSLKKNFNVNKIYSFEPNPEIFKILKNKTNKYLNIEYFNMALGQQKDKIIMYSNIESSSSSLNRLNTKSNYFKKKYFFLNLFNFKPVEKEIDIEMNKLSNIIKYKNIKNIDLIKIDTEGYEYSVLKGAENYLKFFKFIHLEHHFDDMIIKKYNLSDLHNFLIKNGFKKVFKIKMSFRKSFEYIYEKV